VTLKPLTSEKLNDLLNLTEVSINEDKIVAEAVELEMLRELAKTKMFQANISGKDENQEIYESVKDSVDNLRVFIQSLR
jgi:hypothetical protein